MYINRPLYFKILSNNKIGLSGDGEDIFKNIVCYNAKNKSIDEIKQDIIKNHEMCEDDLLIKIV